MYKTIGVEDAIGTVLSHDITLIDPESGYKGARFKKGHVVSESDAAILKRMGRERLNILELGDGDVHEDDAALRVAAAIGAGLKKEGARFSVKGPSEGKCSLIAEQAGLFSFDAEAVHRVNARNEWVFATLPDKIPVSKGETVAAWRVGPLVVKEDAVCHAESCLGPSSFNVLPFRPLKTALVTTGLEIFEGRVRDFFLGKLEKKLALYGAPLIGHNVAPDDEGAIGQSIAAWLSKGAEAVLCTGGMSVDADDVTPAGISSVATEVIFRGAPVLPGSNLMLAVNEDPADGKRRVLLGVPACAVHAEFTVLDTVMHRVYAGLLPTGDEVRRWGVGGLCRGCAACCYPICRFGSR
ncbi:MAG: molybdopterin-binding protein [Synergistaceae bacterium]|nr:molybdopterin-binding protein [Synergistaceae bacterium]